MSQQDSGDEFEQIDEAGEQLEDAEDDISWWDRWYARIYVTGLILILMAGLVLSYRVGIVRPEVQVTVQVSVGWIVEWLAAGMAATFLLWTGAMVLIALPFSFVSAVVSAVARIADAYSLPEDRGP